MSVEIICPFCGYRTQREVSVGEPIPCPWCERSYVPLPAADAAPALVFVPPPEWFVLQQPSRRRPELTKRGCLVALICLAVVLVVCSWGPLQNARDRAKSPPGIVLATRGEVLKVVFSPDGRRLAASGGIYKGRQKWETGEINIWDPVTGRVVLSFPGHPTGVNGLDFSPDGKWLASASSDAVRIWDADTGNELFKLGMHPGEEPWRVAFDPRGERLATLSEHGMHGHGLATMVVRIWRSPRADDRDEPAPVFFYSFEASSSGSGGWRLPTLTFSPDGMRLACGRDNTVLIWDLHPDRRGDQTAPALVLTGHTRAVRDLAFSPDSQRLATASDDETVRIWGAATGQELLSFESPRDGIPGYRGIGCLAFSPDGKRLAGGKAQNLAIWDAATGRQLHYLRWHSNVIESVAFSPDGKWLASGERDREIKLWDLAALERWTGVGQGEK
jgi:WD40 repeat protein